MHWLKLLKFSICFMGLAIGFKGKASIPLVEGLFRHPGNPAITANFLNLKFQLGRLENTQKLEQEQVRSGTDHSQQILGVKDIHRYYSLNFFKNKESKWEFLLLEYDNSKMTAKSLTHVFYGANASDLVVNDVVGERAVFYGLMSMFLGNESQFISSLLKRFNSNHYSNDELINTKKVELLEKYREYLLAIKKNKDLKNSLESPLRPKDKEKLAEVQATMNENFYIKKSDVKLINKGQKFFWKVNLENTDALFEKDTHYLSEFNMQFEKGDLRFLFNEYVMFNGAHYFPKDILIYLPDERLYKFTALSVNHKNLKVSNLAEMYDQYLKIIKRRSTPIDEMANKEFTNFRYTL